VSCSISDRSTRSESSGTSDASDVVLDDQAWVVVGRAEEQVGPVARAERAAAMEGTVEVARQAEAKARPIGTSSQSAATFTGR
jgi:hypothetical protein